MNKPNPVVTYQCGCKVTIKPGASSISPCERHKKDKQTKNKLLASSRGVYKEFQRQKLLGFIKDA